MQHLLLKFYWSSGYFTDFWEALDIQGFLRNLSSFLVKILRIAFDESYKMQLLL